MIRALSLSCVLPAVLLAAGAARAFGEDPELGCSARAAGTDDGPRAVLSVTIPEGWHMYSDSSRAGLPAAVVTDAVMPVWYPAGKKLPDGSSVWEGTVEIVVGPGGREGGVSGLSGVVEGQICTTGRCLPREVAFIVPQQGEGVLPRSAAADATAGVPSSFTRPAAVKEHAPVQRTSVEELAGLLGAQGGVGKNAMPRQPERIAPPSLPHFEPRFAGGGAEVDGFGTAVLFGMAAGLLLNFMPCVLPVLALKIGGFVRAAGDGTRAMREFCLFFTCGVLAFFTLLASGLAWAGAIWGGLFQSEAFLMVMMAVVFLMGLSLFGVFFLPVLGPSRGGAPGHPRVDAVVSGMLATLLATPCSGPLLGGVLGWAFMQSAPVLGATAFSVGLGMSVPYLVLAVRPSLASFLPRPGAWMEFFERGVAFLLVGTSLYLMSLLPAARRMDAAVVLFAASFCAWAWGRFMRPSSGRGERCAGAVLMAAAVGSAWFVLGPAAEAPVVPYSREVLLEAVGKRDILLDFTADWCPNCKLLEKTVLTGRKIAGLRRRGILVMRVDLTERNGDTQELLEAMGSRSLPLTALVSAADPGHPLVLRDLYSAGTLNDALQECFPQRR